MVHILRIPFQYDIVDKGHQTVAELQVDLSALLIAVAPKHVFPHELIVLSDMHIFRTS